MVAAWLEVLEITGVPVEHYDTCYRAARQLQIEHQANGEKTFLLSADDLAAEWLKIRKVNAELNNTRLLSANTRSDCSRCYGTGKEEMPDGSVREGCEHLPLTEAETARKRKERSEAIAFMREAVKQIGNPKPTPTVQPKAEHGIKLICSDCGRKVNSLFGWQEGETCDDLLNRATGDPDLKFCKGRMEPLAT